MLETRRFRTIVPTWSAKACCGPNQASAGVALLEAGVVLAVGGPAVPETGATWPPPTFVRGDELGTVDTLDAAFDQVSLFDLASATKTGGGPAALGGATRAPPALVAVSDALAAIVVELDLRFVLLDPTLGSRLLEVSIPGAAEQPTLTETCGGLIATWLDRDEATLRAVAFDSVGVPHSPVRELGGTFTVGSAGAAAARNAVAWDGKALVVCTAAEVIELDHNAELVSSTPVPEEPLAAVGTEDGLLVLTAGAGPDVLPRVRVLERGTGAVLSELGDLDTVLPAMTGSAVADGGSVAFAASSSETRDALVWAVASCQP